MKFSIIIPVYDRARFLPRLFASLTEQTYRPFQIILVDDGSSDGSLECCRKFQQTYSSGSLPVTVINGEHHGACAARNAGARIALGEYLYFFDSDDEMSPHFLQDVAQALTTVSTADLICARVCLHFPDGHTHARDSLFSASPSHQIISAMLSTQSMVIRKSFFQACGGWNEDLARWNDWELGTRLLLHSPETLWLKPVYHKIHQHKASITGDSFSHSISDLIKSIKAVLKDAETAPVAPETLQAVIKALALKTTILAAAVYREGHIGVAQSLRRWTLSLQPVRSSLAVRLVLRTAYAYASAGGRGAWRLYRLL